MADSRVPSLYRVSGVLCLLTLTTTFVEDSCETSPKAASPGKLLSLKSNVQVSLSRQAGRRKYGRASFEEDTHAYRNDLEKGQLRETKAQAPFVAGSSNAKNINSKKIDLSQESQVDSNGRSLQNQKRFLDEGGSKVGNKTHRTLKENRPELNGRKSQTVFTVSNKEEVTSTNSPNYDKEITQGVPLADHKVRNRQKEDKKAANLKTTIEFSIPRSELWDRFLCSPCVCVKSLSRNRTSAKCHIVWPKGVPANLPKNIWGLDLSYSKLGYFNMHNISLYLHIRILDLNNSQIKSVSSQPAAQFTSSLISVSFHGNYIDDITFMNCSNFPRLQHLVLSRNIIEIIPSSAFAGCHNLKTLDLSRNKIRLIEKNSFDQLINLLKLDLSFNKQLGYATTKFTPGIFQSLQRLEILHLQGSSSGSKYYPNYVLGNLTNLRELFIDGIGGGAEFGREMRNLVHLESLSFSPGFRCFIRNISASFFENIPYIKALTFHSCLLQHIDTNAFRNLSKLERYSIQNPTYCSLSQAFDTLVGLVNSPLKSIAFTGFIRHLSLPCQKIAAFMGKPLQDFMLEELDLSQNEVVVLDIYFIMTFPKTLKKLVLHSNKLTASYFMSSISALIPLPNLHELDLRNQNYEFFETEPVHEDKYHAHLHVLPTDVTSSTERAMVKFQSKNISQYPPTDNEYSYSCNSKNTEDMGFQHTIHVESEIKNKQKAFRSTPMVILPPNLDTLKASRYQYLGRRFLFYKVDSKKLSHIDFSTSFFTDWGKGRLPETVKTANLSYNYCKVLRSDFFPENNSLQSLSIQSNYLGPVISFDVDGDLFAGASQLVYLNVALNSIFHLPTKFLRGFRSLEILVLTENKLQSIEMDFSYTPALQVLYADKNSVRWISISVRRDLDNIASKHALRIDLSYNPLPCTCDGIELLEWLYSTKVYILNKDFLQCVLDNKKEELIGNMEKRINELRAECVQAKYFVIVSVFFGVLFFLIILFALLYRHRWKLIYMRNVWLVNIFGFQPMGNTPKGRIYDAYVVYSQEDSDFALDTMLEELEKKRGHKLCVEDRDFIPGSFNFNNITCAVQNSTVTLLLVSPHFLRGKELEYATQMALMEEYNGQEKRDVLLLLNYKRTDRNSIPTDLLLLMKKGRFLDYPGMDKGEEEGEDGQISDCTLQAFWDRISSEIGHSDRRISSSFLNLGQRR